MITNAQKQALLRSWKLVGPIAETAADLFYRRLFELRPAYRPLFPADLRDQKRKLIKMLGFVVKALDWTDADWRDTPPIEDDLFLVVLALGRRHVVLYRIPDDSYGPVGEALLWTLDQGLGQAFTADVREAWTHVYQLLARTMRMGAAAVGAEASTPANLARIGTLLGE
jgi:hemoglobin-like flavoprotein